MATTGRRSATPPPSRRRQVRTWPMWTGLLFSAAALVLAGYAALTAHDDQGRVDAVNQARNHPQTSVTTVAPPVPPTASPVPSSTRRSTTRTTTTR